VKRPKTVKDVKTLSSRATGVTAGCRHSPALHRPLFVGNHFFSDMPKIYIARHKRQEQISGDEERSSEVCLEEIYSILSAVMSGVRQARNNAKSLRHYKIVRE
jgi:hypothetical protein